MMSVFLRNGHYAAHVALQLRPRLGCFGEESFNSCGSGMKKHARELHVLSVSFDSIGGFQRLFLMEAVTNLNQTEDSSPLGSSPLSGP